MLQTCSGNATVLLLRIKAPSGLSRTTQLSYSGEARAEGYYTIYELCHSQPHNSVLRFTVGFHDHGVYLEDGSPVGLLD